MAVTANKARLRRAQPFRQAPLAGAFSVLAAWGGIASNAQAIDWRFIPNVGAAVTYTDNVNQTETPESALILSVTPAFVLVSEGSRRVEATINYGLTAATRIGQNNSSDVYHNLGAVGKAELIEDLVFIDGTATISQELVSLFGSNADATTNDSNRATLGTYSLSPYIKKRLGTFAIGEVRYTNSGAIFGNNSGSDLNSNEILARLNSGTRFNDWYWGLEYSNRQTSSKDAPDATFERLTGTLGFALTRKLRVFGLYGTEDNDYVGATTNTSGNRYEVGFAWAPTRRTSLEATAGERYFGRTYSFSGSHKTRHTSWRIRYSEDFSDVSQLAINYNDLKSARFSCPSGTVLPENVTYAQAIATPGCRLVGLLFGTSLQNGVFLAKLLTADASWSLGKTELGLSFSDLQRIYQQVSGVDDRTQFVSATVNYRLSRATRLNAGLSLGRVTATSPVASTNREDTLYGLNLGVSHQFSRDLTGALTFRHQERSSSAINSDYSENSLTASANLRF